MHSAGCQRLQMSTCGNILLRPLKSFQMSNVSSNKTKKMETPFFIGSPQYSLVKWKPSFKKTGCAAESLTENTKLRGEASFFESGYWLWRLFLFGSPWIAVGWTECSYYNIPLGRLALFCYFLPSEIFRDFLTNLYQTKFPWLWLTLTQWRQKSK